MGVLLYPKANFPKRKLVLSEVSALEESAGILLPEDYKNLLVAQNGGTIKTQYLVVKTKSKPTSWNVAYFCFVDEYGFAANVSASEGSVSWLNQLFGNFLPKSCLAFDVVMDSHFLYFDLSVRRRGEIYLKCYSDSLEHLPKAVAAKTSRYFVSDSLEDLSMSLFAKDPIAY